MKKDEAFLKHMMDEIKFLTEKCGDIGFEELIGDKVLQRASVRSLEIIGEAKISQVS